MSQETKLSFYRCKLSTFFQVVSLHNFYFLSAQLPLHDCGGSFKFLQLCGAWLFSLICCTVLAEHVSSNASDSESSYSKLLLSLESFCFALLILFVSFILFPCYSFVNTIKTVGANGLEFKFTTTS